MDWPFSKSAENISKNRLIFVATYANSRNKCIYIVSLFSDKIFPTVDYGKSPFVTDVGPFFRIIESMTKMRFWSDYIKKYAQIFCELSLCKKVHRMRIFNAKNIPFFYWTKIKSGSEWNFQFWLAMAIEERRQQLSHEWKRFKFHHPNNLVSKSFSLVCEAVVPFNKICFYSKKELLTNFVR